MPLLFYAVRGMLCGSPPQNDSKSPDNRSLKNQIEAFLSLRLTIIVIDDYIFRPLRTEIDRLKPSSRKLIALQQAVYRSAQAYEHLWHRLDAFQQVKTAVLKTRAAADAAASAGEVNAALKGLEGAVEDLALSASEPLDAQLTEIIRTYTRFPGTVSDIEAYLVKGSPQEVASVINGNERERAAVLKAYNCFLCYLSKKNRGQPPKSADCSHCS